MNHKIWHAIWQIEMRLVIAFSLAMYPTAASFAQETVAPQSNDVVDLVPVDLAQSTEISSGVQSNLDSLLKTTERVRQEIAKPAADKNPPVDFDRLPDPSASRSKGGAQSNRMSDLRKRIELLRRLRSRPTQAVPRQSPEQKAIATDHLPMAIPARSPSIAAKKAADTIEARAPTLSAIEGNLEPTPAKSEASDQAPAVVSAKQILSSPVNHLSLAESLYRTKNYAAALKTLQAIEAEQLIPTDQTWMELLVALCHRRLGDTEKAQAQFRELSNAKIADRSVPIARWWLKQTEMVSATKPALAAITSELDVLIERSVNHVE